MEFGILGPTVVRHGGDINLGGRRRGALVALLAVNRNRPIASGRLVEDLWDGAPPASAVGTLQSHISTLRRLLGADRLVTEGAGYTLLVEDGELDAAVFESRCAEARAAAGRLRFDRARELLDEALAAWRGPALADALGTRWAAGESARLEELRLDAEEAHLEAGLSLGQHFGVAAAAEAAIARRPLRERRWLILMLALYRCGRQADALEAYQRVRRLLVDELGIEPGRELSSLEVAILKQDPSLDAPSAPGAAISTSLSPTPGGQLPLPPALRGDSQPFVGRAGALQAMDSHLGGESGRRIVLIGGEPGVGKTTLAAQAARHAHAAGAAVLYGRCAEEPLMPYQPFAEVMDQLVGGEGMEILRGNLSAAAQLAPLLDSVRRAFPALPPAPSGEPEAQRWRFFEAVAEVLRTAAMRRRLVIVLDDLHWADRPTLLLLDFLINSTDGSGRSIVGTYRTTDLGRAHPLADMLGKLRTEDVVSVIDLRGLTLGDVHDLVRLRPDIEGGELLAPVIHQATQGNALFVRETIRHVAEVGGADLSRIPQGVREVVGRRLARLSTECDSLLHVAAVAGREFNLGVVAGVADVGDDDAVAALAEIVRARIVAEVPGTVDQYAFSHEVVRETLLSELTASRRVRIHRRIAEALERRYGPTPGDHVGELALHFSEAGDNGDPAKAITYSRIAGDRALRVRAFEEASAHFERAIEIAERLAGDEPSPGTLFRLLLGAAQAHIGTPDVPRASARIKAAMDVARAHRDASMLAEASISLVPMEGWVPFMFTDLIHGLVAGMIEALPGLADGPLRVDVLARLAGHPSSHILVKQRLAWAEEAVALAEGIGDPRARTTALIGWRWALFGPDSPEEQLAAAREIAARGRDLDDPGITYIGHYSAIPALIEIGDVKGLDAEVALLAQVADRLGDPGPKLATLFVRTMQAMLAGSIDEAERLAGDVEKAAAPAHPSAALYASVGQYGMIRRLQGRLDELVEPTRHIISIDNDHSPTLAHTLMALLAEVGRLDESRAMWDRMTDEDFDTENLGPVLVLTLRHLSVTCAALGDGRRAARLYDLLLPYAGRNIRVGFAEGCLGPVDRVLGLLATTSGRWALAAGHFNAALATARHMGAIPFILETNCDLAQMLLRRSAAGDPERAGGLLDEVAESADRLGLRGLSQRVDELRGTLGRAVGGH